MRGLSALCLCLGLSGCFKDWDALEEQTRDAAAAMDASAPDGDVVQPPDANVPLPPDPGRGVVQSSGSGTLGTAKWKLEVTVGQPVAAGRLQNSSWTMDVGLGPGEQ